jgi:hypothetical protein
MQADASTLIRHPSNQEMVMTRRFPALAHLAGRTREVRGVLTFTEIAGEVCDAACRSDARLERARTAAIAAGLGYRL